jgi:hypothetical protein
MGVMALDFPKKSQHARLAVILSTLILIGKHKKAKLIRDVDARDTYS